MPLTLICIAGKFAPPTVAVKYERTSSRTGRSAAKVYEMPIGEKLVGLPVSVITAELRVQHPSVFSALHIPEAKLAAAVNRVCEGYAAARLDELEREREALRRKYEQAARALQEEVAALDACKTPLVVDEDGDAETKFCESKVDHGETKFCESKMAEPVYEPVPQLFKSPEQMCRETGGSFADLFAEFDCPSPFGATGLSDTEGVQSGGCRRPAGSASFQEAGTTTTGTTGSRSTTDTLPMSLSDDEGDEEDALSKVDLRASIASYASHHSRRSHDRYGGGNAMARSQEWVLDLDDGGDTNPASLL